MSGGIWGGLPTELTNVFSAKTLIFFKKHPHSLSKKDLNGLPHSTQNIFFEAPGFLLEEFRTELFELSLLLLSSWRLRGFCSVAKPGLCVFVSGLRIPSLQLYHVVSLRSGSQGGF